MRIAFDTGGTFTDCVYLRDGRIEILKIPSTPRHPAEAIAQALEQIWQSGSGLFCPGLDLRHHRRDKRVAAEARRARGAGDDARV